MSTPELDVVEVRGSRAAEVVGVIHRAFAARPVLDPPSDALEETVESIARTLDETGGLLATRRGRAVGAMVFDESRNGLLGLRRVSVDPGGQGRGVATAMVGVAEDIAASREKDGLWLHLREELPENIRFWKRLRYFRVGQSGPFVEMEKTLPVDVDVAALNEMNALAERIAQLVRAGDLLILSGDLGAGKTTFTKAFGEALGVRGPITSPTFVLARRHPNLGTGPDLVHVDAYRLGAAAEIDDIDLDATTDTAVTVVEWGVGLAEQLSDSWLQLNFESIPADPNSEPVDEEPRLVKVRPHGRRWVGVPLRSALLPPK